MGIKKGATIAMQGFGNVGRIAARLLHEQGYKIIAIGDINGGIQNPEGIDIPTLEDYAIEHRSVVGFPGTTPISNKELFAIECDILMPAAVQSVIHDGNAADVKAKVVMECANGPVTPEGEKILQEKGVHIVPDVLTNCGSAIVCGFERTQGLTDSYWDIEMVNDKLKERIVKAYRETVETAEKKNTSYRNAAWINALDKLSKSMKARGWV